MVLLLVEEATAAANIVVEAAERLSSQTARSIFGDCRFNDADGNSVTAHDDNDGDGRISAGDSIRFQEGDCDDRDTEIRLDVTEASIVDSAIASLAGRLSYSRVPVGQTAASGPEDNRGSFTLDYRRTDTGSTRSHTGIDMSLSTGGMTDRLTGGDLQNVIAGLQYNVEFEGRIQIDSLDGSFGFRTTTPFSGQLGDFPTTGELRLETQDSAAVVAPAADVDVANQHAAYRVDTTGTGQFSDPVSVPWVDWIAGSLFNWHGFIRNLIIEPRRPVTTDSLSAVADFYNPQQKQLSFTYEWLIGNIAHTFDSRPEILPSEYTAKGSIGLRLIVSDGTIADIWTLNRTILNSAPRLDAVIGPDAPDTTHDIMVDHVTSDADADSVSVSYQWQVNGQLLEDETGATLPAGRHRKNDVVRVVVNADDGESTTSQTLSVTTVDAVPRIQLSGVPGTVSYASPVEFAATVSDPDGDDVSQFRFGMEYGPVGMNVDPQTGRIAWSGKMPMFGPEMFVHWQVGSSSEASVSAASTVRLVDPGRPYPLMRTSVGSPAEDRLFVGDFDADGDEEILVHDQFRTVFMIEWDGEDYVQSWAHPFSVHEYGIDAVASADIDGDGRHEIFLHAEDRMVRLDGETRHVSATAEVPRALTFAQDLHVADLDGDGSWEVVFMADADGPESRLVVLSADDLSLRWQSPPGRLGWFLDVGNVDRDPALEIVVSGGYAYDGTTRELEWSHPSTSDPRSFRTGTENDVTTADLDGDGVEEVVGYLDKVPSSPALEAIRIPSGDRLGASTPLNNYFVRLPWIEDVDQDGVPELFGETGRDLIFAYRYDSSVDEFVRTAEVQSPHLAAAFGAGDLDRDGRPEIMWGGSPQGLNDTGLYSVAEFDGNFHLEWTQPADRQWDDIYLGGRPVSGPTTGEDRLLFVSGAPGRLDANPHSDAPRIVFLSPSSGSISLGPRLDGGHPPQPNYRWYIGAADTTDYDRDGVSEVLMSMSHAFDMGRLVAFDPVNSLDEWSVAGPESITYTPLVSADFNGDGFDDLLTRSAVYDMVEGTVLWEPDSYQLEGARIAAGDLDGDGRAEIVYADQVGRLNILSPGGAGAGSPPRVVALDHDRVFDLIAADTDHDGRDEILVVSNRTGHVESQAIFRFDAQGQLLNSFLVGVGPLWDPVRLLVLPGAGRKQVVLTVSSFFNYETRLVSFDPVTGTRLWESPELLGVVSPDSLHYVDVEGEPRLAIGTSRALYLTR